MGTEPDSVVVALNPTCVWTPTLTASDPTTGAPVDWPAGTTCTVEFSDFATAFSLVITAVVSGPNISFAMTAAQSDSVPDGSVAHFYLDTSGNGTGRRLWLSGAVVVRD